MSNQPLITEIESAASRAARFYCCNLHAHSPGSSDYGQPSDLEGSPAIYSPDEKGLPHSEWLRRVMETGLQVVAVTDHNVHSWACGAAASAPSGLVVLPGCEVSVYHKSVLSDVVVHLLAVFDVGTDCEHIERVFSRLKCTQSESGRDAGYVLEADLDSVVEAIHDLDGLCIAAHVGSNSGARTASLLLSYEVLTYEARLRQLGGQACRTPAEDEEAKQLRTKLSLALNKAQERYLEFLVASRVDAVQIAKPTDEKHYGMLHVAPLGADRPVACVLATDSHRLCDVCLPKYITYIKMDRPSVGGLRKAFRDPGTRVRFRAQPVAPYPRIRGLAFLGSDTFFGRGADSDSVYVGFSDNLTCAIGGRGSGKSCIVEGIRYAQGVAPAHAISKRGKEEYDRYLSHIMGTGTVVAVVETSPSERLVVKRTYGTSGSPTVSQPDGVHRHMDASSVLRVDVYGQSELEQVAGDKGAQRKLIDASVDSVDDLYHAVQQAEADIRANSQQVVQAARDVVRHHGRLGTLRDVKGQLQRLTEPRLQEIIGKQKVVAELRGYGQLVRGKSQSIATHLGHISSETEALQEKDRELSALLEDGVGGQVHPAVRQALDEVRSALAIVASATTSVRDAITSTGNALSQFEEAVRTAEESIDLEVAQQGDDLAPILEQRQQLQQKYAAMQPDETARSDAFAKLETLLSARTDTLTPAREQAARALSAARSVALAQVSAAIDALPGPSLGITLTLQSQADRTAFGLALGHHQGEGFLKGNDIPRHKYDRSWASRIAECMTPASFVSSLLRRDIQPLAQVTKADGTRLLDDTDIARLLEARSPVAADDRYAIDVERLETLLDLADNHMPDDRPVIALDGRPVEDLSPGQRCSALLPIILLSGDHPIVIDQPEDNIDNLHVFDCLVSVLRELKHKRQIICATHNANIVVSGDAEQVVVCEGCDKDSGRIARQASIDDEDSMDPTDGVVSGIVSHVKRVMEGGELAFKTRARKYGYRIEV